MGMCEAKAALIDSHDLDQGDVLDDLLIPEPATGKNLILVHSRNKLVFPSKARRPDVREPTVELGCTGDAFSKYRSAAACVRAAPALPAAHWMIDASIKGAKEAGDHFHQFLLIALGPGYGLDLYGTRRRSRNHWTRRTLTLPRTRMGRATFQCLLGSLDAGINRRGRGQCLLGWTDAETCSTPRIRICSADFEAETPGVIRPLDQRIRSVVTFRT